MAAPKQPIKRAAGQTVEEMAIQLQHNAADNRLNRKPIYKEISEQMKAEALATAIDQHTTLLQRLRERGRVDLNNVDEIAEIANNYMQSCKSANVYPSLLGFSAALGYSRQHLYRYLEAHDNETTRYIDALRSSWAAILAQAGLTRRASEPIVIFMLKNSGQGLRDQNEITVASSDNSPFGTGKTREELEQEYLDSVVID